MTAAHRFGALVAVTVATAGAWLWPGIPPGARAVLWVYGLALVGWVGTPLNAGYVGLAAVALLLALGAVPQERAAELLAADVVWLILGAFLLGEAMTRSGLAARVTAWVASGATNARGLGWRVTAWAVALAFVVPSTTARAALLLPLLRALPPDQDGRIRRCFGLLIPCVVLMSTPVTLTGAAAHLLANDLLAAAGHPPVSFARWLLLAGPFGAAAAVLTAWLVMRRHLPVAPTAVVEGQNGTEVPPAAAWSRAERTTLGVVVGLLALWTTTGLHPLGFVTVMLLGVLVLVAPGVGPLDWKDALRAVPWDMIVLAGAAVWLGRSLTESGASGWAVRQVLDAVGLGRNAGPAAALILVTVVAVTAHLYLTSHTARVAALAPPLIALAGEAGWNPTVVVFVAAVGIDYCVTFPVSSKAVLLYEFDSGQAADLLRLSLVLTPAYILLVVAFYFAWWAPLGLRL
jgi:anion transporter